MTLKERGTGNLSSDHSLCLGLRFTSKPYSWGQKPEISTQSQDRHQKQAENQEKRDGKKNQESLLLKIKLKETHPIQNKGGPSHMRYRKSVALQSTGFGVFCKKAESESLKPRFCTQTTQLSFPGMKPDVDSSSTLSY